MLEKASSKRFGNDLEVIKNRTLSVSCIKEEEISTKKAKLSIDSSNDNQNRQYTHKNDNKKEITICITSNISNGLLTDFFAELLINTNNGLDRI